jgi:hypothetical protein
MMLSLRTAGLPAAFLATLVGCGGPPEPTRLPVTGTVTLDGDPIGNALVSFLPEANTKTLPSFAATAPDGKYVLRAPQGQKGIEAGTYRVTVSRLLRKDGTPPPPDVPPIESDAFETLPPMYSDPALTVLRVTIDPGGSTTADLPLKSKKK